MVAKKQRGAKFAVAGARKRKKDKGKKGKKKKRVDSIFALNSDSGADAQTRKEKKKLKSASLAVAGQEYQAVLSMHPRGFGFARLVDPAEAARFKKDIFLPPGSALGGAIHGDLVLIQVTRQARLGAEGQVLKILQRGITKLVGFYSGGKGGGLVIPEDDRLPYQIMVKRPRDLRVRKGDAVYAEIEKFRAEGHLEGRILEVLGDPADAKVQIEMAIRSFELPARFAADLLAEAEDLDKRVRMSKRRQDLRQIPFVTIDGDDARDFDDAVAVESRTNGFRLYVAIADVSHYVKPGSLLDAEAYARGTSVYFPGRVLPMLPEQLSNKLCSLMPGVARYTFTAIIDFDKKGRRQQASFQHSLIKSRHRLTYSQVRAILEDHEPELCRLYADVVADLGQLQRLAKLLNRIRMGRGSIGFEIPEADIRLDEKGRVDRICRSERNIAHKLIEECMLAANEAVAEFLERKQAQALYRIHEEPDPVKVVEFAEFAACLGLKIPPSSSDPGWFGQVLKAVKNTPREYIVSNLLLRSMQQARYSPENTGHFGLAASHYTHFTSPIRRYPDLLVHRALTALLDDQGKKVAKSSILAAGHSIAAAASWLSRRERVAVDAERNVNDRLAALYMSDRVGEEFAAVVSGVGSFGVFVELLEIMLSGAVALAEMVDDYYQVEEKSHRLVGQRTGKSYQIGDLVRVRLIEVDQRRRRLNFVLV